MIGAPKDTDGLNRIQTENAITGTTNWMLFNPITATNLHGWPTDPADTTPEIQGFASATSANVGDTIDLYGDVRRTNDTNFTLEIFRLGWYGGQGGRQMTWNDSGNRTNIVLNSHIQPVPKMNPTNGLIDCLSGWTTNGTDTNLIWQRSYTLAIPTNWVSGVYVARLTTGTNVTPQTTGKQSYIIFTVREDGRTSDLLFQNSVTTWQAYNPYGGNSLYPYPHSASCQEPIAYADSAYAEKVSFNRPYAPPTCYLGYLPLGYGSGAGEFLTVINQFATAAWEYDMVRWLERQGYDVTYSTSVDTDRSCPADKGIKAFLSVGHDEYWSASQRANVEAARDRGINLGFFGANICFARIHYEANERVFSVNKTTSAHGYYDLWRDTMVNNPEISMIGVEYAYNAVDTDMQMRNPLAAGSGIGGLHWAYDYAGLTNGAVLTKLLGSEVDGCWSPTNLSCIDVLADCPKPETVRLADSIFMPPGCTNAVGHAYMTIYTACNGAQVFAAGTMQWNWGLDDFGAAAQFQPKLRANSAAQQMTHNVLRTFSGKPTAPVIFTNADSITSGNWTNTYGSSGYWIADTTTRTNLPSYAQVTLSSQQVQVWTNVTTDTRALLEPANYTNRIAAAWTTTTNQGSSFTIDLNLASGHTNQIALYCVDWLGTGTVLERIEVFDYADFPHPLDTRDFQLPANGVYLVWKLSGHKLIRITKPDSTSGTKAMVSALFIGD